MLRAVVYPDVERAHATRLATIAKALGDPVRLQLVDVLRKHAGKVCVCELVPLFDISQPTLSHHLKMLRDAGIVDSERRGLWAYYYVVPGALDELGAWLGDRRSPSSGLRERGAGNATQLPRNHEDVISAVVIRAARARSCPVPAMPRRLPSRGNVSVDLDASRSPGPRAPSTIAAASDGLTS